MEQEFDVVVIGSGPGGYVAAVRAAQLGFKTACVEKNPKLGGTCLNVGCIPSKALLQSSEHYEFIQQKAKEHGIEAPSVTFDFGHMQTRKQQVVTGLVDSIANLFKRDQVARIDGFAKLTSPHTIEVLGADGKQTLRAKYILLATGSEPIALPFLPFDEKRVVSSTGVLALPNVPNRLAVIGGGVIGLELASVYRRLGSKVQIIEMLDRICPTMDKAVSRGLLQVLKKQGLEFFLSTQLTKAEVQGEVITLFTKSGEQEQQHQADVVLVAVGRRPFTQGLGLKEIGVEMSNRGFVLVDSQFRSSVPGIFAIGDVVDGPMLAHRASEEGIALVESLAGKRAQVNYMAIPNVIYTHPEAASVGMTEEEAQAAGLELITGTVYFKGNPRARCAADTDGFVKIIGEKHSKRVIGLHILGPNASEMIGEGVMAIEKKATMEEVAAASHAHPTLTESIKEAALKALGHAIH